MVFTCNICGARQVSKNQRFDREEPSCEACGSSLRMRSVVHCLSTALWGRSMILPEFPRKPEITGAGLSDWDGYAMRLADKLSYRNTYYHKSPKLDICSPPQHLLSSLDFLISSDVFEHTNPPASTAFEGAFEVLKPGGWLILTVPYTCRGQAVEKYPELHQYTVAKVADRWVIVNLTKDGQFQLFPDPVFHGGDGATIAVRFFSLELVRDLLRAAGFTDMKVHDENVAEFGIVWDIEDHLPIVARKPLR